MKRFRKGQFSTYLKPMIVIIFALLLIFLLHRVLDFQMFVDEGVERADFMESMNTNFISITRCLRVEEPTALYTLDSEKLHDYNDTYRIKEPSCAEDFKYGYSVKIEHNCLENIEDLSAGTCEPEKFHFGAIESSTGPSLSSTITTTFPVTIHIKEGLRVPGSMEIELRDGDLEELAGTINRIIERSENQDTDVHETVRYSNEQEICSENDKVCLKTNMNCIKLREELESGFSLSPGSYYLDIAYENGELRVHGGNDDGC